MFCPLFLLREFLQVLLGRQKKQVKRLIFCIGIIRFDLALLMIFVHTAFVLIKTKKNKKQKIGENLQNFSFLLA
jgi:hypothetical protein